MKRQIYDYRDLRISTILEPRYRHVLLWGTWIIYLTCYFATDHLIPASSCHVMHCGLDDMFPFNEYFVVFYISWFVLVGFSLAYYFFYDVERFKQLDIYIFIIQMIATAIYIIYPTCQNMRPEVFTDANICTWLLGHIYTIDTSTGVCPSLHVGLSLAILSVVSKDPHVPRSAKIALAILVTLIALSTAMVKQHSVIDGFAVLPVVLVAELIVYHRKKIPLIHKTAKTS